MIRSRSQSFKGGESSTPKMAALAVLTLVYVMLFASMNVCPYLYLS